LRLLRLEMQGFKSFADKTVIEFGPGVTGIIGPNGCGKSNISDAIRWVLGEQSLKNLRGSKSEDVIFSGSSSRRALNLAEVSLIFDNTDHYFAIDYDEVVVGRRIYRSGEGAYLLNRKPCRLKDIVDLFRDTGLGRDALAVLGQNKIDELLSCTPEERRGAFEELAGISRFKSRKKDALRRLEQTEQNLLRIQDLMVTMAEEIPILEEAKKKTEAYQAIKQEMRAGELRWFVHEWEKLEAQEKKLREEEQGFSDADKKAEELRQRRLVLMAEVEKKLKEGESALRLWREEYEQVQGILQNIHTEIAVQSERLEQNNSLVRLLEEDEAKRLENQQIIEKQVQEIQEKLAEAKESQMSKDEAFRSVQEEQSKMQERWNKIQGRLEAGRDDGFSSLQEIVSLRNRNQTLADDQARYGRQEEKINQEKELLTRQKEEVLIEAKKLSESRRSTQKELDEKKALISGKRSDNQDLQEKKKSSVQELEKLRSEEQDMRLRFRWLNDMLANHEGFSHGVKSLLQAKASWREGILGTVAELFVVQPEYRTALEVALGNNMQNVICRNDTNAREGIAFLKSKKAGRVTFLPLTTLQIGDSKREESLLNHKGCLGRASDFVSSPKEVEKVVRFLLYRTLVVENMEIALEIGRASGFSTRIVTLQGEILRPGGSLTGGGSGKERESFWGRREEAERLAGVLTEKQKEVTATEKRWKDLLAEETKQIKELENLEAEVQELYTKEKVYQEQFGHIDHRQQRLADDISELNEELKEIKAQKYQAQEIVHQIEVELQKAQYKEDERKSQIESLQGESNQLETEREQIQQKLTRLQVEVFGNEQECQHLMERKISLDNSLSIEKASLVDIQKRQSEIDNVLKNGAIRLESLTKDKGESEEKLVSLQEGVKKTEAQWQSLLNEKQEKEKEFILQEREEGKLRERRHDWEMRFQRLTFEQEKWISYLTEEFQMTVEAALEEVDAEMPTKGLSERLAVLRGRISEIGEINPYAVEEYQRHQEKYGFYEAQSTDLQSARQSLQRLLNELNREMADQFSQTFEEVRVKFQRIFLELFGGGKAELSLTDPGQILETGVEIFVQPPGKKLQNMTLLSGGERALTVIALLFAFMECRPSPFYLADEVDAALDEANVRRFSQFLKEYSEKSQFIVVTHRRGTMEISDTLHGITMEDAGISKLISVRFEGDQATFGG
jgi:chromosome segregation protein SMC, common bacterial type